MEDTDYQLFPVVMETKQDGDSNTHNSGENSNVDERQRGSNLNARNTINNDVTGNNGSSFNTTTNCDKNPADVTIENDDAHKRSPLIYKLTDTPPLYSIPFFVLQQGILAISTPLLTAFLVAEVICAGDDDETKTRILSATFFMIGLSTIAMVTIGVRLPIFQGPNFTYVLPILSMIKLDEFKCPAVFDYTDPITNATSRMARISNDTMISKDEFIKGRINELAGSLILVGAVHFLIGVTGLVGLIQRHVGPITIVPIVLLFGIQIHAVVLGFAQTHWGTAMLVVVIAIVLGVYLEKHNTPLPFWTPSRGIFVTWQPIHNVLSIFISISIGWLVCYFLTYYNVLSNDPESKEFLARTDSRIQIVHDMDWFLFPYPGQFGAPSFNLTAAISFFIATLLSVLDCIADYSQSAKISCAPQPPRFALNRGVAVEGLMILLGGAFGCGHGTVSFGENIGAMKISRVVSRTVFQGCGVMYLMFAFIGKFGAFFITIPHSVMGGSQIITFGLLIGVILSYLQYVDLNSTRNVSILGITILLGMMMPQWVSDNGEDMGTGNYRLDTVVKILLSNPAFVGGATACFLDNTIPGTRTERGIAYQVQGVNDDNNDDGNDNEDDDDDDSVAKVELSDGNYKNDTNCMLHGTEVYRLPWLPDSFRKSSIARFIPIFDCEVDCESNYV